MLLSLFVCLLFWVCLFVSMFVCISIFLIYLFVWGQLLVFLTLCLVDCAPVVVCFFVFYICFFVIFFINLLNCLFGGPGAGFPDALSARLCSCRCLFVYLLVFSLFVYLLCLNIFCLSFVCLGPGAGFPDALSGRLCSCHYLFLCLFVYQFL